MDLDLGARDQIGDLGFLEIGIDVELVDRHKCCEPLAGGDEIAILYREIADDAVIGRAAAP